ncbi:MAG: hypothetical protein KA180_16345 [Gemmatimonadales bacterium]|nr:hypothetical protein [Gemmatimonadales bacterium]MBP9199036.1 hypothetical protein [Gemmatimonadales bacterium]
MRARLVLLTAALLAACGGGDSTGSSKTTLVYGGVFAGEDGTEGGNFTINIVVEDSAGSGTFVVNGDPKTLSSLDVSGTSFTATGAGYTFTGTVDDTTLGGTYTSASGGGLFTGLRRLPGTTVTAYCGTHIGTRNGVPMAGAFAFAERGSSRRGVFTSVLDDPFRGYLRGTVGNPAVSLDTLAGTAVVATTGPGGFSGSYAMVAGDTGQTSGSVCRSNVASPILSVIEGVLGSFDGAEVGDFSFSLSSTGLGSSGSYKLGGIARNFLAVISGVNNQVAAFDSTLRFIGDIDTTTVNGRYSEGGSIAGRAGGIFTDTLGVEKYCGALTYGTSGAGAFAFVLRADSAIYGTYTGGVGSAFQGSVSGYWLNDSLARMEGQTGLVVIIPSPGSFGGYFDLAGTGVDGTMTGGNCP